MLTNNFLLPFLAMSCFGVAFFLAARSSKDVGALKSMFLFQFIGIPFFILFLPFIKVEFTLISLSQVLLVGVYETFVMLLFFHAYEVGEISVVSPLIESYALFVLILGVVFLHESINVMKVTGGILVFIGIVLLSIKIANKKIVQKINLHKGVISAIISAVGTAGFFILTGVVARSAGWFVTALGIRLGISMTAFLLFLFFKKEPWQNLFKNVPYQWIAPAAFFDVIGFVLYNIAIINSEVSYVSIIISAQTLVTVLLSYIFLKERLKSYQLLGLLSVFLGLIALNLKK